ncbi:hypothetical protein [Methanoregula sp.]|uniref:hypothetical protein n=1 Tax=Methanoregula sp. TaxID=2052170 RepID=UPI0035634C6C
MKYTLILCVLSGLILCALIAGCTSPTGAAIPPVETPVTPPPTTASTSAATVVSTPVAVDTLPAEQYVDLRLTKERPDASIHLLFNGGKGEIVVQSILLRVTRSDGQVIESSMNDGTRKPRRGDEVVITGTRGNDRAEVFVTSAGKTYKVLDQPILSSPS